MRPLEDDEMPTWIATAAFGLEGLVKQELQALGFQATAENGGARFQADTAGAFYANLHLRTADRVQLLLKEGEATSFEALFQLVRSITWEDYLPPDARFPVSGHCARSQLMSVSDCQAITKKAIVERLKDSCKKDWFEETGALYAVSLTLHENRARLTLDASGEALNKRGYRTWNGEAPLRETLAAALIDLSPWQGGLPLHDPCCGTGTLLIEAAFRMARRAPGLTRPFAMEQWGFVDRASCQRMRDEAKALFDPSLVEGITGSDVDPEALVLCKRHIVQAGLGGRIQVFQKDLRDLEPLAEGTVVVTNPPYGERMSSRKEAQSLYRQMRRLEEKTRGGRVCVLTSDAAFEKLYGRRASKKRRLYNGRLECEFLVF
ncbi:MAG: class I SAM-dependent RNA methyltransferase [Christensenellales bacterium]